jgi:hypothetical protein
MSRARTGDNGDEEHELRRYGKSMRVLGHMHHRVGRQMGILGRLFKLMILSYTYKTVHNSPSCRQVDRQSESHSIRLQYRSILVGSPLLPALIIYLIVSHDFSLSSPSRLHNNNLDPTTDYRTYSKL